VQEIWFLATINVVEKNKKLLQNVLLQDFAATLYFSRRHSILLSKANFLVVRGVLLLLKEVGSIAKKGMLWFCR
jgi:hypothetical protein